MKALKWIVIIVIAATLPWGYQNLSRPTPDLEEPDDESFAPVISREPQPLSLEKFYLGEGRMILRTRQELDAFAEDWMGRIRDLGRAIRDTGRNPDHDRDYVAWNERLDKLRKDRRQLNAMANDAYISWVKFRQIPSSESEKRFEQILSEGKAQVVLISNKYRQLKILKNPRLARASLETERILKIRPRQIKTANGRRREESISSEPLTLASVTMPKHIRWRLNALEKQFHEIASNLTAARQHILDEMERLHSGSSEDLQKQNVWPKKIVAGEEAKPAPEAVGCIMVWKKGELGKIYTGKPKETVYAAFGEPDQIENGAWVFEGIKLEGDDQTLLRNVLFIFRFGKVESVKVEISDSLI